MLPAMGTPAGYYRPFARALAVRGISVLLAEIPGTGASRPPPSRRRDYAYRDLYGTYVPRLLTRARECVPSVPLVLMGHSLGAHVGALAVLTGSVQVDALVTLAGGNIHYRNWDGAGRFGIRLAGAGFALLARLLGYLPGHLVGFGGPQAKSLIGEWAGVIKSGRYEHITGGQALSGRARTLCIGFEGDPMAPTESVRALAVMIQGRMDILPVSGKGKPHSYWAREPDLTADRIDRWLGPG